MDEEIINFLLGFGDSGRVITCWDLRADYFINKLLHCSYLAPKYYYKCLFNPRSEPMKEVTVKYPCYMDERLRHGEMKSTAQDYSW